MGLFDNLFKKATDFVNEHAKSLEGLEKQFDNFKENLQGNLQDFVQQQNGGKTLENKIFK